MLWYVLLEYRHFNMFCFYASDEIREMKAIRLPGAVRYRHHEKRKAYLFIINNTFFTSCFVFLCHQAIFPQNLRMTFVLRSINFLSYKFALTHFVDVRNAIAASSIFKVE